METIMGVLLESLGLFYPLFLASVVTFVYPIIKRSWIWMLLSAILIFPDAWFFSKHPPFPWAIFVPLVQVVFAILFYLWKRNCKM
ncbi:hypothetical protein [Sporosarcina sp. G11-34]|uniref:hypothetical protein n=1 Tax=Sporosarcina sp. G11-34 TaxID=2849605 RepID=UPI0022A91C83|nr:hypothetical protein [Sporosarcina sp. G11-34]MCZ2258140.1 hypothetical protein [Sporosarcina sp. G11-34]